jgi:tRNA 5-methylaminomethyl-2-thiouridine biosynthesis bifunctional protein
MSRPPLATASVVWDGDIPRSTRFDDPYYARAGGLAEARAVFLAGCDLPRAWAGRRRYVVGELGFGTGLNIAALLELWRRTKPDGADLHIFTVEAYPLPVVDARRALAAWPEIGEVAAALTAQWPRHARGFHRIELGAFDAILDVAIMEVEQGLDAWTGRADAWFLDGFAPSRNPAMWSEPVLAGVARRSAPGARVATFTVSGVVRRGLQAQGFRVEKKPGFAAKRERLEGSRPGRVPTDRRPSPRVAIVGAGIAGASLARALRVLGVRPLVLEAAAAGAGASGNPAALVMPRLDAGGGLIGAFYAQALTRSLDLFVGAPGALIARGAYQIEVSAKDPQRFDRIAASDLFEGGAVGRLDAAALSAALGESIRHGGLVIRDACVVEPRVVLDAWLAGTERIVATVGAIERADRDWRLLDRDGLEIARADIVFVANGLGASQLVPDAPLAALRGQVSLASPPAPPALIGAGYALPTRDGVLIGATHDRGDESADVRAVDDVRNLERLASSVPALARRLAASAMDGRAGVRAVTPDFLPLAGEAGASGLFILSGLGSRGFCSAPLLAEHLAAIALDSPSPLPAAIADIVDPGRFARRRARRAGRSDAVQADRLR